MSGILSGIFAFTTSSGFLATKPRFFPPPTLLRDCFSCCCLLASAAAAAAAEILADLALEIAFDHHGLTLEFLVIGGLPLLEYK